jgi:hypothetical protein
MNSGKSPAIGADYRAIGFARKVKGHLYECGAAARTLVSWSDWTWSMFDRRVNERNSPIASSISRSRCFGTQTFSAPSGNGQRRSFMAHPHNSWLWTSQHFAAACCGHLTEGEGRHRSAHRSAQTKRPSHHSAAKEGERRQCEKADAITPIRSHVWSDSADRNQFQPAAHATPATEPRFSVRLLAVVK